MIVNYLTSVKLGCVPAYGRVDESKWLGIFKCGLISKNTGILVVHLCNKRNP